MTKPERDPREEIMLKIIHCWSPVDLPSPSEIREALARLDAADPIRQVWPELVGTLEACEGAIASVSKDVFGRDERYGHSYRDELLDEIRAALAKTQEIEETPDAD